ncbi:MAG: TFIIB-type zinc ribbon-containing protein [Flavisolibacter sp.]
MNCPNCNETLVMADRQGVEIDYCPKCRGVWLDKGELDKLIERSATYNYKEDDRNDDRYDDRNDDRYKDQKQYPPQDGQYNDPNYKRKKKRGFLSDFLDFD